VDRLAAEALKTNEDAKRAQLLAKATEIAIGDVGLIPSHYQVNTWSVRKGLKYKARSDEYTLATHVSGK
jgi:peptide/nickel transport system substrate-binding protein